MKKNRDYIYNSFTMSLCAKCMKTIPSKIIEKNGSVYIKKNCPAHGKQVELIEEDASYYKARHKFDKPSTYCEPQTKTIKGCPFDCGLCPAHDQHTCIGLFEITDRCDQKCPLCYARSGEGNMLSLKKIEKMLDFYVASEGGEAEILQISGGEPTTHPDILKIISLAKSKKIKYVMLNTNGLRLSKDEKLAEELGKMSGRFEIYLQFDGFKQSTHKTLRGKNLLEEKKKAIANLAKYKVPITLVATIMNNVNDDEIGDIINFAMSTGGIRGINFQPVAFFGRHAKADTGNRITLTGIIGRAEKQTSGIIKFTDFIPLPCDVERVAVAYFYKKENDYVPLTRQLQVDKYLPLIRNTFAFNANDILKDVASGVIKLNSGCDCLGFLRDFLNVTPPKLLLKSKKAREAYVNDNTFRISVTSFIDKYNFDMKSAQKECVHVITKELKKMPFSTYNILHRNKIK